MRVDDRSKARTSGAFVEQACVIVLLMALVGLGGCSVRGKEISEANVREVIAQIEQSNDLTPEETDLLKAYLMRHAFNAASAPLPVKVGEAIEGQRAFIAQIEAREQAERAAAQQAEEARRAQIEQLRAEVGVQLVRIEYIPSDIHARRFSDALTFGLRVVNRGQRALRGVRGRLVFLDTFGSEVASLEMPIERDIAAGGSSEPTMSKDYNQFMQSDVALRGFDLERGRVEWQPEQIVYADGTQVTVPERAGARR